MVNIAFLGPLGTYSHQAALQQFSDEKANFIPLKTIPQCFEELIKDTALDYAVVPLENSTNGQVVFTYDILRDLMNNCSKFEGNQAIPELEIVAEQYVSIDLCLIAPKGIDLNAFSSNTVVKIYSHPQVWGQISGYLEDLRKKVKHVQLVDASSTSGAVEISCKAESSGSEEVVLAIASRAAAAMHDAMILDGPINDKKGNTTRFLTLRRRTPNGEPIKASPSTPSGDQTVSLLTFIVKQDSPGSLVDVLNVFKDYNINMCSISSRPYHHVCGSPSEDENAQRKWQYIFFVEFNHSAGLDWTAIAAEINYKTLKFCLWGTFYRNGRYYEITA